MSPVDRDGAAIGRARDAKHRHRTRLLRLPNVHGVGVGLKRTRGRLTRTLCVRVYVRRKVALRELRPNERIPRRVGGIPTDVVEFVPKPFACRAEGSPDHVRRLPSLQGGISVGMLNSVGIGTLTLAIYDIETHREMLMSNAHVIASLPRRGEPIIQPAGPARTASISDGGGPQDIMGFLERWIYDDELDVAVAHTSGLRFAEQGTIGIGVLRGSADPVLGGTVRKSGRSSGVTTGVITDDDAEFDIDEAGGEVRHARRRILIEGTDIVCPGDSGSPVFDDRGGLVGVLANGSDDGTIAAACRMTTVLERLNVRMDRGVDLQSSVAATTLLLG